MIAVIGQFTAIALSLFFDIGLFLADFFRYDFSTMDSVFPNSTGVLVFLLLFVAIGMIGWVFGLINTLFRR